MELNRLTNTVDWLSGNGIFTAMARNNSLPWSNNPSAIDLDYDYYGNHSGNKITSCLVDKLSDDKGKLSTENMGRLASIIFSKYHENWERAWYALSIEYNPIHNYDRNESITTERIYENDNNNTLKNTKTHNLSVDNTGTITDSDKLTRTGTDTTHIVNDEDKTGSDILTKSGKETSTDTKNGSMIESNEIAGYNSSSYSNDSKKTTSYNNYKDTNELSYTTRTDKQDYNTNVNTVNDETVTHNTTDTDNKTTTNNLKEETTGTISDNGTNNNHENGSESTTVTTKNNGNIGVTTTQQMLQSEIEFRAVTNFFNDIVYKNIDEVLTINVY